MKRLILGVCMGLLALSSVQAQRSEMGVFAGGSFYLGDINPAGLFSQTQPAFGALYRYNLSTRWTLRSNVLWGRVKADDAKYNRLDRNLSFRSQIAEFSMMAELSFLPYFTGSNRSYRFSPYLFGGIAVFSFNPQASNYNALLAKNEWIDLAPLSTEGQGLSSYPDKQPYSTTQISLPFGLGFKYSLNRIFCVGVEWGMRKTFTDYIDDVGGTYVSQSSLMSERGNQAAYFADPVAADQKHVEGSMRGSAGKTDWYSFAGVTLTARIGRPRQEPCAANKQSAVDRIKRSMEY
ncbi:MAG: DUF6089 family protein [Bacteroidales bacterium]|jgi:hypothetical protein|nr:DUF6089 family protein [Bacteroidales bacterium]